MENHNHSFIDSSSYKNMIKELYGQGESIYTQQKQRYRDLLDSFYIKFPSENPALYSTPGRIEIGGNHTDHNHGRVIAAGINLDSIAAASKNTDNTI